jgi:hypothetical protein
MIRSKRTVLAVPGVLASLSPSTSSWKYSWIREPWTARTAWTGIIRRSLSQQLDRSDPAPTSGIVAVRTVLRHCLTPSHRMLVRQAK